MSSICWKFLLFCHLLVINGTAAKKSRDDADDRCTSVTATLGNSVQFNCIGLTELRSHIQDAPKNPTSINIFNSKISVIPRQSFTKFGTTLIDLDLRKSGIEIIEQDGFSDLYTLKKLILSENKLTRINGESFRNLPELRHLDISFNNIYFIDSIFYQPERFPLLENWYFDYNQLEAIDYPLFSMLYSLRKVKFGKNPWKWGYRLLLTQQVENSRVDYRDDWEEWGWMSNVARECEETGKAGRIPADTILDCAILRLLRMLIAGSNEGTAAGFSQNSTSNSVCLSEAIALVDCYIRSSTPAEAIRKTLEGLTATLRQIGSASGKVHSYPLVAIH